MRGHPEGERGHADGAFPAHSHWHGGDAPKQQHDGRAERQLSSGRNRGQYQLVSFETLEAQCFLEDGTCIRNVALGVRDSTHARRPYHFWQLEG